MAWTCATQLYDAGVVFRTAASALVQPTSPAAGAAILRAMASHALQSAVPLSSIPNSCQRGSELRRQCLGRVDGFNDDEGVSAKLLDGSVALVDRCCSHALPFTDVQDLVLQEVLVLFRPTSKSHGRDGVLMPAASDSGRCTIVLIECICFCNVNSITNCGACVLLPVV